MPQVKASTSASLALARQSSGPRTTLGKERSKLNATTHGIFSKVAVLKGESQAELDALIAGLRKDFRPIGTLEENLVELLAVTMWRQRRLLTAETAEIEAETAPFDSEDSKNLAVEKPWCFRRGGMVNEISDSRSLKRCLDLLEALKYIIRSDGFDLQRDKKILSELYGDIHLRVENDLLVTLSTQHTIPNANGQLPSLEKCKKDFLEELAKEKVRLIRYQAEQETLRRKQMKLEADRRKVPDSPRLDQLLRYSSSLERTIDRTLSQLERAQRMRLGQPVLPRIDVNVSS